MVQYDPRYHQSNTLRKKFSRLHAVRDEHYVALANAVTCILWKSWDPDLTRGCWVCEIKCCIGIKHDSFSENGNNDLVSLRWLQPPANILLVQKDCSSTATDALKEFGRFVLAPFLLLEYPLILVCSSHIKSTYPSVNIILEPAVASSLGGTLGYDVYSATLTPQHDHPYQDKVDLIVTFGGDGTILHASSLFATSENVPPVLSFSMGTLGFLGEWKFAEYKRAFREVYMSGAQLERKDNLGSVMSLGDSPEGPTGWSSVRGKSLGNSHEARVLIRNRLKVGLFNPSGQRLNGNGDIRLGTGDIHAMNEVIIHRGKDPHLAVVDVFVGGRFLTEAVADGMIISTPTGSTAYNLSSGGCIVHPLVSSILLTPICARSLSFRPLVLPASTPITLKLSQKNRSKQIEVSVDGVNLRQGISVGTELRVVGEELAKKDGHWFGGIPCVVRRSSGGIDGDDGWVGGLNGLLKFNYPFGEET